MKLSNIAHPWSAVEAKQERLKIKSNSNFLYMHNPKNWELAQIKIGKKSKPVLLPVFSVLRLTAGVNLVRKNGRSTSSGVAVANAKEQGFTIIEPAAYDYIRVYPCINGNRYEDAFTVFEDLGGSLIRSYNHQGFDEFRTKLMRDGYLNPPHEHFIKLMLIENQKLIDKYAQLVHNPNHEALYNKAIQKDKDLRVVLKLLKEGNDLYGQR